MSEIGAVELGCIVQDLIEMHPSRVEAYQDGREDESYFVGRIEQQIDGTIDEATIRPMVTHMLAEASP